MIRKHTILALISGLIIYGGCLLGALTKAPAVMLLFTYVIPGLAFGIALAMANDISDPKKNFLVIIASVIIYTLAIYIADAPDRIKVLSPAIKTIVASITGAILLSLSYDLISNKKIQITRSFINPLLLGLISSLLSAFSISRLGLIKYDQPVQEFLCQMGIFSIYPIWQVLFIMNTKRSG